MTRLARLGAVKAGGSSGTGSNLAISGGRFHACAADGGPAVDHRRLPRVGSEHNRRQLRAGFRESDDLMIFFAPDSFPE